MLSIVLCGPPARAFELIVVLRAAAHQDFLKSVLRKKPFEDKEKKSDADFFELELFQECVS